MFVLFSKPPLHEHRSPKCDTQLSDACELNEEPKHE